MTTTMRFLAALLALVVVTMPSKADDSKTYTCLLYTSPSPRD